MLMTERPLAERQLVSAACHNEEQLVHAEHICVDFVVVCPIFDTPSSPEKTGMGWDGFTALIKTTKLPVFALGGVSPMDLATAQDCGAVGIAAKRALWAS